MALRASAAVDVSVQYLFGDLGSDRDSGLFDGNVIAGGLFTCPEAATPVSITAGAYAFNDGVYERCAIYSASGSLVCYTEEKVVPNASGLSSTPDVTFNIVDPQALQADTPYYLVAWGEAGSSAALHSHWDGSSNVVGFSAAYGVFPSSVSFSMAQAGSVAAIYCTYRPVN